MNFTFQTGTMLSASSWTEAAPNWVTAAATLGALGAAIWAGKTAKQLYDKEHERDRDRADELRRSQAGQVAAWASWTDVPSAALRLPNGEVNRLNLALRNDSPTPVYDVRISYSCEGEDLGSQLFHLLSPTGGHPHHREIKADGVRGLVAKPREPGERLDIRVAVEFTDANGVRWTRNTLGRLREVATPLADR